MQVSQVVFIPVVAQRPFLLVLAVQQNIEIPQLLFDRVGDVPVVPVGRVPQEQVVEETVLIPQAQLVVKVVALRGVFQSCSSVKTIVLIPVMSTCPVLGQGCCPFLCKSLGGRQKTVRWRLGAERGIVPQIMEEILMEFSQFLDR